MTLIHPRHNSPHLLAPRPAVCWFHLSYTALAKFETPQASVVAIGYKHADNKTQQEAEQGKINQVSMKQRNSPPRFSECLQCRGRRKISRKKTFYPETRGLGGSERPRRIIYPVLGSGITYMRYHPLVILARCSLPHNTSWKKKCMRQVFFPFTCQCTAHTHTAHVSG